MSGQVAYASELLRELAGLKGDHELVLYGYDGSFDHPISEISELAHTRRVTVRRTGNKAIDYLSLQFLILRDLYLGRIDLLHVLSQQDLGFAAGPRVVATIHDLAELDRDTYGSGWAVWLRSRRVRRASAVGLILTGSEFSKNRICARLGVPSNRVWVIPNGVSERFRELAPDERALARTKLRFEGQTILHVGNFTWNKNHAVLIRAFGRVRDEISAGRLVLVGRKDIGDFHAAMSAIEGAGLQDHVTVITDTLDPEELVHLYNAVDAFVLPSKYEGFGLPLLEAFACGVPTMVSDRASLPEIAGDAALCASCDDEVAMARAIVRLLNDVELRAELRCRGLSRAKAYSWKAAAFAVTEAYRRQWRLAKNTG